MSLNQARIHSRNRSLGPLAKSALGCVQPLAALALALGAISAGVVQEWFGGMGPVKGISFVYRRGDQRIEAVLDPKAGRNLEAQAGKCLGEIPEGFSSPNGLRIRTQRATRFWDNVPPFPPMRLGYTALEKGWVTADGKSQRQWKPVEIDPAPRHAAAAAVEGLLASAGKSNSARDRECLRNF